MRQRTTARASAPGWRPAVSPPGPLAVAALLLLLLAVTALGWPWPGGRAGVPSARHVIPLAPITLTRPVPGQLERPFNFGYRCTLVDAATILNDYGATPTQTALALRLSAATDYNAHGGPPWWVYVAPPGQRPLLDRAIERVGAGAGVPVHAQTQVGLDFVQAVAAIVRNQPVILNVLRTPDGTYNHSLLAIGFDTRAGHSLLLVLDPNTQDEYWIGPASLWSTTITSTYITPTASPPGP